MENIKRTLTTKTGLSFEIQLGPPASINSFFVFSLHKAGSTLLNEMLTAVCRQLAIPVFSPESEEFRNGAMLGTLDDSVCQWFVPKGYCFAGFRSFPNYLEGFDLTSFKKILLIRDPRDMLVSHYFSQKFSHHLPPGELGAKLQAIRSSLNQKTIDQYALESAAEVKHKYARYQQAVFDENLKLYRYEDVIFSKRKWLASVLEFVGIELPSAASDRIADGQDFRPAVEDLGRHVRQVTPGDHINKLQPETILKLNEIFADELARFGYLPADSEATVTASRPALQLQSVGDRSETAPEHDFRID